MPSHSPQKSRSELQYWRKEFDRRKRLMQEFKALYSVVPTSEAQDAWIMRTIEQFMRDHPELDRELERFFRDDLQKLEKQIEFLTSLRERIPYK